MGWKREWIVVEEIVMVVTSVHHAMSTAIAEGGRASCSLTVQTPRVLLTILGLTAHLMSVLIVWTQSCFSHGAMPKRTDWTLLNTVLSHVAFVWVRA